MTLEELKKIAEAATPGPWEFCPGSKDGLDHWELWNPETSESIVQDDSGVEPSIENLTYFATFNPSLVAKLIAVAMAGKKHMAYRHAQVCGEVQQKTQDRTFCSCSNDELGAALLELLSDS